MQIQSVGGRVIEYARISLTDRCNFRCTYCMPECGVNEIAHDDIMRYEDILFLVDVLSQLGIKKVRFTGGEPTVRRGFVSFMRSFKERFPDIALFVTTNGSTLAKTAKELAQIPMSGINVSLDTIDEEKFKKITRLGDAETVRAGIEAAVIAGNKVKTNTVLMRGFNDDEALDILKYVWSVGATPRFIEFMPLESGVWDKERYISAQELLARFAEVMDALPVPYKTARQQEGPAKYFRDEATGNVFGVISAVSDHFCSSCNRIRFTAAGSLMPCLFSSTQMPLIDQIRSRDAGSLASAILRGMMTKPRHWEALDREDTHMSSIGG